MLHEQLQAAIASLNARRRIWIYTSAERARIAELRVEMAALAAGEKRGWYMELRLIDQLLLNQHLEAAERDEIRGNVDASFIAVKVKETAPPARAAVASVPKAVRAGVGSSFAALEALGEDARDDLRLRAVQ